MVGCLPCPTPNILSAATSFTENVTRLRSEMDRMESFGSKGDLHQKSCNWQIRWKSLCAWSNHPNWKIHSSCMLRLEFQNRKLRTKICRTSSVISSDIQHWQNVGELTRWRLS
jgi:hypothetical protein